MPYSAPMAYEQEDRDSATPTWVVIFIVASLLAHVILISVIVILSKHIPSPKLESTASTPTATITMIQPPVAPPQPKKIFMTTPAQKNAPHVETQVESDHDTKAASESKVARNPNSIMPDVVSPDKHASSLQSSPSAPPVKQQDPTTTPPTPKTQEAKPNPNPPQPPTPPQPKADPQKAKPMDATKPPPPKATPAPKTPPQPAFDENGLPVLPSLSAPTMAPQTAANAQASQTAAPPPSMPVIPPNIQGRAGMSGAPTPDAMKTDLGAYKALFYQAVGSRWYNKVAQQMQLIGVGSVRVQYTIMPDGTITTKVLDGGNGSMQILLTISVSSIREVSPFRPFPASMLKDYPEGYTDDFSFSVY